MQEVKEERDTVRELREALAKTHAISTSQVRIWGHVPCNPDNTRLA